MLSVTKISFIHIRTKSTGSLLAEECQAARVLSYQMKTIWLYLAALKVCKNQIKIGTRRYSLLAPKDKGCPIEKKKCGRGDWKKYLLIFPFPPRKNSVLPFLENKLHVAWLSPPFTCDIPTLLYCILSYKNLLFCQAFIFVWQKTSIFVK